MPEYKWHPIEDLPEALYSYSDPDLRLLKEEWQEVRDKTPQDTLDQILAEIKREWAIETGKIEGLYTLSEGITKTLIQSGISTKNIEQYKSNIGEIRLVEILSDQQEVIEGLMDYVAQNKQLTLTYIRQMHQVFTRHQDTTEGMAEDGKIVDVPMIKGAWKKWPNNPLQQDKTLHEYCPPEQVPNEMEHLLELHQKHVAGHVNPEIEAAFLHHRFTQIHPFQDGNGRVARALASLVLLRAGYFPFVVRDEERAGYIDALEEADRGNIPALVEFMSEKQKDLIYISIKKSQDINFSSNLNLVEKEIEEFVDNFELRKQRVKDADFIILIWLESAKDVINKYDEKIIKKKLTEDSLIEKISTDFKEIRTDKTTPGSVEHLIGRMHIYDFLIQFPFQNKNYALRLSPSTINDQEIILRAKFDDPNGNNISSLDVPSNIDYRMADLQFRDWFQKEFGCIVENWLNIQT